MSGYSSGDEAEKDCICRICPSYAECGEKVAFCFPERGKSKCIGEENGCLCPGCPVLEQMGFAHDYYCTRGSEKEQGAR